MWQLKNIRIKASGKSAWFGGGLVVKETIDYLWSHGHVATTGGCECVGMAGAGLGGGHGRLEGLYGLISDNFLQLNVVLGNGSHIRVNSTSHSDLLWGMKGAGANFGIVTSYEMKIWPKGPKTWHYHNYIWRGEHLETVFNKLNSLMGNGTTPINMVSAAGSLFMNTTISTEEPVLFWSFLYRGTAKEAERYLAPFNAIEAVYDLVGDVPYPEVAHAQGSGNDDAICQHGNEYRTSTVFIREWNTTAERRIFEGFKRRAATDPILAVGCSMLHEAYSTEKVEAIDSRSSAYPFRTDRHLTLFNAIVPHNDTVRGAAAEAWAAEVRDEWRAGQPHRPFNAYVNYANGLETLEERYGHEAWRLERLRTLKARYDPDNRFRFFNPIVV
jgi:hypothetical protein